VDQSIIVAILALAAGLLIGWLQASRRAGGLSADLAVAQSKAADAELAAKARDAVERERNDAMRDLAALRAQAADRAATVDSLRTELAAIRADRDAARTGLATMTAQIEAFEARLVDMRDAKEVMAAQFNDLANKALTDAQKAFLDRAEARFRQSEELAGTNLKSLLQPVNDRLLRYEEGVAKVEAERSATSRGRSNRCALARSAFRAKRPSSSTPSAMRPRPAVAGANSSFATCWKAAGWPNTPISRWKSASRTVRAVACAPMPS
jgi:chromosome segregation ATPase